jgi:hypothetical protein
VPGSKPALMGAAALASLPLLARRRFPVHSALCAFAGAGVLPLIDQTAAAHSSGGFEERTRIAREPHDVIAHCVSVMTVQAGAARLLVEQDPRRARESLLARCRRAGLPVELRLEGARDAGTRHRPGRRPRRPGGAHQRDLARGAGARAGHRAP